MQRTFNAISKHLKIVQTVALIISISIFSGCYRVDVPQGNVITDSDLARINLGMKREEVLAELGTPLVTDPFHANRWDYFYSVKHLKRSEDTSQSIALIFEDDALKEIIGQTQISEEAVVSHNEFKSRQRRKRGKGIITRIGELFSGDE